MPRPRLLIFCLLLGILTTITIAWTLALWPSKPYAGYTLHMPIAPSLDGGAASITIYQEARPGVCSIFFSVSADSPRGLGPAWAPLVRIWSGAPLWRLKPSHQAEINRVLVEFSSLNADNPPIASASPVWPRWLPGIPPTPCGLIAYGGRTAGWPFPTLRSTLRVDPDALENHWTGSLPVKQSAFYRRAGGLMLQDPASGCVPFIPTAAFPLAALMWSAAWFVLLCTPRLLRTAHRRRAGRCPACGYDLRGAAPGSACPECGARSPLSPPIRSHP